MFIGVACVFIISVANPWILNRNCPASQVSLLWTKAWACLHYCSSAEDLNSGSFMEVFRALHCFLSDASPKPELWQRVPTMILVLTQHHLTATNLKLRTEDLKIRNLDLRIEV